MERFTSEDIKALREYLDKLEALNQETPPEKLSHEEWEEALTAIHETGKIPERFVGRIGENEVEVNDGIEMIYDDNGNPVLNENGEPRYKHVFYDKPHKSKGYYDIAQEAYYKRLHDINKAYEKTVDKVIFASFEDRKKQGKEHNPKGECIEDLVRAVIEANTAEVLDITNLPNLLPTDERFQYAITPLRNEYAYILPFNYEQLEFSYNEDGEIIIDSPAQYKAVEEAKDKKHKITAAGIDQPLLRQLFAATMKAYLCNYGSSITVSLPAFAREMNIDMRFSTDKETKHNPNDFFKKLKALENLNGVWQGGSFYRVFILEGYERERNELTFTSPWLFKIIRELLTTPAAKKTRADGSIIWGITGVSGLMKASINSARSKPTVEIIASLLQGLKVRGVEPDSKLHPKRKYKDKDLVEYSISFKTLIDRIPLIRENLDACTPSNKTTLLQRYFCGTSGKGKRREKTILQEYIEEYTFIPQYYKDFKITFNPPTWKTINETITITHHGINGDFKRNNPLSLFMQDETPGEV